MKKWLMALAAATVLLVAGCSGGGAPKAVAPETTFDFGDVVTTADQKTHEFAIKNEGTGDLKLSDVQVKLLQGC